MKKLLVTCFMILNITIFALPQNHLAMLYSSAGMEYGKANAVDSDTNYINTALFQNTINVDPNGVFNLTAPGATTQVAISKYNRRGELVWGLSISAVRAVRRTAFVPVW